MLPWLLNALARGVQRRPHLFVAFWLGLALCGALARPHLEARLVQAGQPPLGSPSAEVQRELRAAFPRFAGLSHLVVLHHPNEPLAPGRLQALQDTLGAVPIVHSVSTWALDAPGTHALLVVTAEAVPAAQAVQTLRAAIPPDARAGVEISVTGASAASFDLFELLGKRLAVIETASLILAAMALAYVFGSMLLVGVTLGAGLCCLAILPGLTYLLSLGLPVSTLNMVIAAVFALALGLDYPLFFLNRLREEYAGDAAIALEKTLSSAGGTILVSAGVMIAGGMSLWFVPSGELRSIALTIAGSAVLAAGLTLGFIPAVLLLYAGRWDLAARLRLERREASDRLWGELARRVTSRPVSALVGSLLLFGLLIAPVTQLKSWAPYISQLPAELEAKQGLDRLLAIRQGGGISPVLVLWKADRPEGVLSADFIRHLRAVSSGIAEDPRIARVESAASLPVPPEALKAIARAPAFLRGNADLGLSPDGRVAMMRVTSRLAPDDPRGEDLIQGLRDRLENTPFPGVRPMVGGMQAELTDTQSAFARGLPWVVGSTLLAVTVLLGLYLRSVVLPLKALLTNLLPVLAALGLVVMVFQWGWGPEILRAGPPMPLQSTTVTILLSVLFAVSMDYEIFMLARIRESYDQSGEPKEAIARGLSRSGRVVLGAALILLGVFVPYMAIEVRGLKELGVGLSAAILIDATLVRLLLVPAVMVLLGRWNYWVPGRRKFFPKLTKTQR